MIRQKDRKMKRSEFLNKQNLNGNKTDNVYLDLIKEESYFESMNNENLLEEKDTVVNDIDDLSNLDEIF